jgi:hypothetical protein
MTLPPKSDPQTEKIKDGIRRRPAPVAESPCTTLGTGVSVTASSRMIQENVLARHNSRARLPRHARTGNFALPHYLLEDEGEVE